MASGARPLAARADRARRGVGGGPRRHRPRRLGGARGARRRARPDRASRSRPSGSSTSARTPRCAGRRCATRATSCPTSASSSATTRRRRRIDPRPGGSSCSATASAAGPVSFTYDDLPRLPPVARDRVHRVRRQRPQPLRHASRARRRPGTQWKLGAIGVARWRGVPLSDVLERAGLRDDAVDVMPEGLDAAVRHRRRRPRATCAARCRSPRRSTTCCRARDERRAAAARPRLPGAARRARLGRHREHQVARPHRGLDDAAVRRGTRPVPVLRRLAAHDAAGQERVRARRGTRRCRRADAACSPAARGRARARSARSRSAPTAARPGAARACTGRTCATPGCAGTLPWTPRRRPAPVELSRARPTRDGLSPSPTVVPFNDLGYQFWAVARHPVTVV